MLKYIGRRLLYMLPALFLSVVLAFLLSEASPTDPAEGIININAGEKVQHQSAKNIESQYHELRHEFGLDLPAFYFSISSLAQIDTLYKLNRSNERKTLSRLSDMYGNPEIIIKYCSELRRLNNELESRIADSTNNDRLLEMRNTADLLFALWNNESITYQLDNLSHLSSDDKELHAMVAECRNAYKDIIEKATHWKKFIPVIHWYGFHNRFNHWLGGIFTGDFGISFSERRPVMSIIKEALPYTILLNGLAILIAFLISIPMGVYMSVKRNSFTDRALSVFMFMLYSLPVFWIATLLIIYFGGGDHFSWFPSSGVSELGADAGFLKKAIDICWHLILPVFCLVYGSFAFISRQMRSAMNNSFRQDYIRTARAKGMNENTITWKHAFRNSLLPMVTLSASILPALISGSVVVESIFSWPGIGQKSYMAVQSQDYPVIFALLVITAVLTMFGNLAADVLYASINPRISFTKENAN